MTSRTVRGLALLAAFLMIGLQPARGQQGRRERGLGRAVAGGAARRAVRVQPGSGSEMLSGADAITALRGRLGDRVRQRGDNPDDIITLLTVDPSVAVGPDGQAVFLDAAAPEDVAVEPDPAATTAPTDTVPDPDALALNGLPLHHSKPGAGWTVFLDFESRTVPVHPFMRILFASTPRSTITTSGLTLDADSTTFVAEEQDLISKTWARVAEDWAPFDVDVTTEQPASFATNAWGGPRVIWNLVTQNENVLGYSPFSLYGIAAAANLCGVSNNFTGQTAFTFWGTVGATDHGLLADTISHETGHVVGLVHDGVMLGSGFAQYYAGHGTGATSWGPLMGGPTDRNVTQWSNGGYPNASNGGICGPTMQDDLAHITQTFGPALDDVSDTLGAAPALGLPATGVIGTTTDTDVYALPGAGEVRIDVTPFRAGALTDGGNLDVAAEVVNAAGLVVASTDDLSATAATLATTLPSGQHYLRIRASFDPATYPLYGSVGQYTVTGTFTNPVRLTRVAHPRPGADLTPGRRLPVRFTLSDAVTRARVQLWDEASPLAASVLAEAPCAALRGERQRCVLHVPRRLPRGRTYWLALQYEAPDGSWVTADVEPGTGLSNPIALDRR